MLISADQLTAHWRYKHQHKNMLTQKNKLSTAKKKEIKNRKSSMKYSRAKIAAWNMRKGGKLKKTGKYHQVTRCMWCSKKQLYRSYSSDNIFYKSVFTCSSCWACPVCAAKISQRRKQEVKKALDEHLKNNGGVSFLTLTFPHGREDKLKDQLDKLSLALKYFKSDSRYKRLRKKVKHIGDIKALEVTHGNNGWHPHNHVLFFTEEPIENLDEVRKELYELWVKACKKAGIEEPDFEHGLTFQDGSFAGSYISKWGVEDEITKVNLKDGKNGSRTLFQLLDSRRKKDGELFFEAQEALYNKTQLHWSPGLKGRFGINDKTDKELNEEKVDDAVKIGELDSKQWRFVMTTTMERLETARFKEYWEKLFVGMCDSKTAKFHDLRAYVLVVAEELGMEGVYKFLDDFGFSYLDSS